MNTEMVDSTGEHFSFYPGVPAILSAARQVGVPMSLASRTHTPDLARDMLRGIYIPHLPVGKHGAGNGTQLEESNSSGEGTKQNPPTRAMDFFLHPQMYPGSKIAHFKAIQRHTLSDHRFSPSSSSSLSNTTTDLDGQANPQTQRPNQGNKVEYEDMIFFDDESRNRDVEKELGVVFVLVRDGVTAEEVDRGVREWRRRRGFGVGGKGDGSDKVNGVGMEVGAGREDEW
jgi:magnesium-dependent phosphatase 1